MEEFIYQYLSSLWVLIEGLWFYLLIAFMAAGAVTEFVSTERLVRYFGKNDVPSLLRATFAGLAASTCSCGAIVLAATFRDRGMSTATILTFIMAAPFLGLPMIFVFVSFMGLANTMLLMAFGLLVAFISGLFLARLENAGKIEPKVTKKEKKACVHCHEEHCDHMKQGNGERLLKVPGHAVRAFLDIGKWILIGLFIAAFVKTFIAPETIIEYLGPERGVSSVIVALPFAVVIETCSEGFAIVGGQLYSMGASLAVIFVLLMVGVATDLTELLVIWKKVGKRAALAYICIGTVLTMIASLFLLSLA
jgi:uncharacterized membrane protein YraQ (UPF0718 family)